MTEIRFKAYAGDCLVEGFLDLAMGVRMTERLNEATVVSIRRAVLRALDDGRVVAAGDIELGVDELLIVEPPAADAPGAHRIHTRSVPVEMHVGPYKLAGRLHGPPTGDPVLALSRRRTMIPVTAASVIYSMAGEEVTVERDVVIVNRDYMHAIQRPTYERGRIDELGLAPVDPRARDLTDELYQDPGGASHSR